LNFLFPQVSLPKKASIYSFQVNAFFKKIYLKFSKSFLIKKQMQGVIHQLEE